MWVLRTGRHGAGSHTPGPRTVPGQTGLSAGEGVTPASCGPGRPGSWHLPARFSSPPLGPLVPPSSSKNMHRKGETPRDLTVLVGGSMTLTLAMQTIYNYCLSSEVLREHDTRSFIHLGHTSLQQEADSYTRLGRGPVSWHRPSPRLHPLPTHSPSLPSTADPMAGFPAPTDTAWKQEHLLTTRTCVSKPDECRREHVTKKHKAKIKQNKKNVSGNRGSYRPVPTGWWRPARQAHGARRSPVHHSTGHQARPCKESGLPSLKNHYLHSTPRNIIQQLKKKKKRSRGTSNAYHQQRSQ